MPYPRGEPEARSAPNAWLRAARIGPVASGIQRPPKRGAGGHEENSTALGGQPGQDRTAHTGSRPCRRRLLSLWPAQNREATPRASATCGLTPRPCDRALVPLSSRNPAPANVGGASSRRRIGSEGTNNLWYQASHWGRKARSRLRSELPFVFPARVRGSLRLESAVWDVGSRSLRRWARVSSQLGLAVQRFPAWSRRRGRAGVPSATTAAAIASSGLMPEMWSRSTRDPVSSTAGTIQCDCPRCGLTVTLLSAISTRIVHSRRVVPRSATRRVRRRSDNAANHAACIDGTAATAFVLTRR